ncbi:unnamed protein product [Caenorhabditis auriculariae]|uniref:Major facilitator superfamily (MFS) profile domain-containing protein n=1 Tax=Caenorhabditis auriculariae TaxID=2777116 RepID=A0A8S1HIW2_9PELO|nr:unnamed protein product [Caenorhabditis auriculariae]
MKPEGTSWNVVYLVGLFSLIQNTQYSIYLTTLFSYMLKLNDKATEAHFGWVMATSSLGHCVGCFVLGYWNSRTGKAKPSLICGFTLMLASNLIYMTIEYLPPAVVVHAMMISRLLGGLGMGNSTPMRACASSHSTSQDRPKAMASISGGRSVGTIVGPGLQLMFLPLGEMGIAVFPGLRIHSNNAPAVLGIVLTIIGFIGIFFFFDETVENVESDKVAITESQKISDEYPQPDKLAMFICMLTRFIQNFTQIAIETLAPAILMLMFHQSRTQAVATMATTYLITGLIATVLYLAIIFTKLSKYVRDRSSNTIILLLFVAHLLATYPWQFYQNEVYAKNNETGIGCDVDRFSWCSGLTEAPQWVFYIGYILSYGAFMPFLNVANATLYSKLLHPDRQGTEQSLYDISNTVARIFAPLLITLIYTMFGPRRAWEFMAIGLLLTSALWIIFDRRLVPLKPINNSYSDTQSTHSGNFTEEEEEQKNNVMKF